MKTVAGDLLAMARSGDFDVIVHGCNCFCAMGAGIALQIRNQFPEAYAADRQTEPGDASKLGTITQATVNTDHGPLTIVNAYTQFKPDGRGRLADYKAIRRCFNTITRKHGGERIGIPRIGAGLAGGDWTVISAIIEDETAGEDVTLVDYRPNKS